MQLPSASHEWMGQNCLLRTELQGCYNTSLLGFGSVALKQLSKMKTELHNLEVPYMMQEEDF
jgi:hypothetical protein